MKSKVFSSATRVAHCDGIPLIAIQDGLSMSPAQMSRMAEQGIPVSSQSLDNQFYDGDANPSWDVAPENTRGIDMADLWMLKKQSQKKALHAHLSDVQKFGE